MTLLQDIHRFLRETFKVKRDRRRMPREQFVYMWLVIGLFAVVFGGIGLLIWLGFLLGGWVWWFLIPYFTILVFWCMFLGWWETEYLD